MAATVLNGTTTGGSVTWANTTGSDVRVIVNYFGSPTPTTSSTSYGIQLNLSGVSYQATSAVAIGKNLAPAKSVSINTTQQAVPVEFYLPVRTPTPSSFTLGRITGSGEFSYNIVIVPEEG